jgi:hypothetical protein
MEALPYYRWRVRDFRASRKVQRMGYIARGFYRELLDEEWIEGPLPSDLPSLAEICGCPLKVMEKAWPEIAPCFELIDGRLVNAKLESLRTEQDTLRVKRIAAGHLGGIAKQSAADAKQVLAPAKQVTYRREEERREEDIACTSAEVHAVITLPLKGEKEYPVTQFDLAEWAKCYPALDLAKEFGEMRGWLLGNPQRRKTATGVGKFIAGWLSRSQDDRNKHPAPLVMPKPALPVQPVFEHRSTAVSLEEMRRAAGIR